MNVPLLPKLPGNLGDLNSFDPASMTWALLSAATGSDPPPAVRHSHGFSSTGGKLYVHSGKNWNGNTNTYIHAYAQTYFSKNLCVCMPVFMVPLLM
jgi:hypothetical protein